MFVRVYSDVVFTNGILPTLVKKPLRDWFGEKLFKYGHSTQNVFLWNPSGFVVSVACRNSSGLGGST